MDETGNIVMAVDEVNFLSRRSTVALIVSFQLSSTRCLINVAPHLLHVQIGDLLQLVDRHLVNQVIRTASLLGRRHDLGGFRKRLNALWRGDR